VNRWLRATGLACVATAMTMMTAGCGGSDSAGGTASAPGNKQVLMDPSSDEMTQRAPATFEAHFETTKGTFVIEVERKLSPRGADRFYNLVRQGFYNGNRFFRVLPNFVVQWGMNGDPELTKIWYNASIQDDPVQTSNVKGTITFAKQNSPNTRTTQLFINLADNTNLDGMAFAPFGRVVQGMEIVEAINAEYGQTASQQKIGEQGNAYLEQNFPNMDYIVEATIE